MIRRRRWIQPEFFTSEDVLALPRDARLTFIGLWLYADDYGRERTNAALIKADVWPLDDEITADVVEEHLLLLAERGMIRLYLANGREFFELTGWGQHQPVQNPSRSSIPPPPALCAAHEPIQPVPTSTETARSEGEGREREGVRGREGDGCEGVPEGGREGAAGPPPAETASGQPHLPPSPFCPRHRANPTSKSCKDCGNARVAFKYWQATQTIEESA